MQSTRKVIPLAPIVNKIFIIFILCISLIGLKYQLIPVMGKQLVKSDIILLLMFAVSLPLSLVRGQRSPISKKVYWAFFAIMAYAFLTTIWVQFGGVGYWYTFYELALFGLTITIPYLISTIATDRYIDLNKLISNFSVVLSLVFLYYIYTMKTGMRLGGYLGGAALISAIMIPTVAVHLSNVLQRKRLLISLICTFITLSAIFLTSSRAGLLTLILFLVLTVLRKISIKRIIAVAIPTAIFLPLILKFASTDRYRQGFEDSYRSINIETGLAYATHSVSAFLFGNGYGSIWQWFAYQSGALYYWTYPLMETEFGPVMYHPHSVFIALFAQLGVVGTLPFIFILCIIFKEFMASRKANNEMRANVLGALICTFISMNTDLYFFRNWEISIIWLFFLFTALAYPSRSTNNLKNPDPELPKI